MSRHIKIKNIKKLYPFIGLGFIVKQFRYFNTLGFFNSNNRLFNMSFFYNVFKEKVKIRIFYKLSNSNINRYKFNKFFRNNLNLDLINKLEKRLDIILLKVGIACSLSQSRKLIRLKCILINGYIITNYFFEVCLNDIITIKSYNNNILELIKTNIINFIIRKSIIDFHSVVKINNNLYFIENFIIINKNNFSIIIIKESTILNSLFNFNSIAFS